MNYFAVLVILAGIWLIWRGVAYPHPWVMARLVRWIGGGLLCAAGIIYLVVT